MATAINPLITSLLFPKISLSDDLIIEDLLFSISKPHHHLIFCHSLDKTALITHFLNFHRKNTF